MESQQQGNGQPLVTGSTMDVSKSERIQVIDDEKHFTSVYFLSFVECRSDCSGQRPTDVSDRTLGTQRCRF